MPPLYKNKKSYYFILFALVFFPFPSSMQNFTADDDFVHTKCSFVCQPATEILSFGFGKNNWICPKVFFVCVIPLRFRWQRTTGFLVNVGDTTVLYLLRTCCSAFLRACLVDGKQNFIKIISIYSIKTIFKRSTDSVIWRVSYIFKALSLMHFAHPFKSRATPSSAHTHTRGPIVIVPRPRLRRSFVSTDARSLRK